MLPRVGFRLAHPAETCLSQKAPLEPTSGGIRQEAQVFALRMTGLPRSPESPQKLCGQSFGHDVKRRATRTPVVCPRPSCFAGNSLPPTTPLGHQCMLDSSPLWVRGICQIPCRCLSRLQLALQLVRSYSLLGQPAALAAALSQFHVSFLGEGSSGELSRTSSNTASAAIQVRVRPETGRTGSAGVGASQAMEVR